MSKSRRKRERAEALEREFRRRGLATAATIREELMGRIHSGRLDLSSHLLPDARALAVAAPKLVAPSGEPFELRAAMPGFDSAHFEPVRYEASRNAYEPYVRFESLVVPCRAHIKGVLLDPVLIEVLPLHSHDTLPEFADAADVSELDASEFLLPPMVRARLGQLTYPDRGLPGEGLACVVDGRAYIVQCAEHRCSEWFFRVGELRGCELLGATLVSLDSLPPDMKVIGTNEIASSDVYRVLGLDWRRIVAQ